MYCYLFIYLLMCWFTSNINVLKRTAVEDLIVFKVISIFRDSYISAIRSFPYVLNKVYGSGILEAVPHKSGFIATKGFHSYNPNRFKFENGQVVGDSGKIISYAYLDPPIYATCIIPKGAQYLENEYGEIVSNQIKIVNVCR